MENRLPLYPLVRSHWIFHLVFWLLYWGFHVLMYGSYDGKYEFAIAYESLSFPVKIVVVYINLYLLMPHFLFRRQYGFYFTFLLLVMVAAGFLRWMLLYWGMPYFVPNIVEKYNGDYWLSIHRILGGIAVVVYVVGLTMAIKLFKFWYQNQRITQVLSKEKLEAELKFLKTQMQPHFLFNTLNNLYALTLKKAENAPEVVLKLSAMMHYMLYECNGNWVPLDKEIEYLQNYIALEKMRYGERLDVSLHVSLEVRGRYIAPMLLLPFVENSFKHGISDSIDQGWVSIALAEKEGGIVIKVENSKADAPVSYGKGKGIGLRNVRRRLDLIYKDQYDLRIYDDEDTYLVVLILGLVDPVFEFAHS